MKRWNERNGMDEWLQVPAVEYAFVISDCVGFVESVGKPPLISLD